MGGGPMKKRGLVLLLGVALFLAGCTGALTKIGSEIAADKGYISKDQKAAIINTEEAFRKSFEELTEEEEYYIGRAVAATILSRYKVYSHTNLTRYINRVGRAVSLASSRPEIYNGYRFMLLDTDEVNAFAAPGGFIFITRGMLALIRDEESLAAVLAHEVGHVAGRHGLGAIKKSRLVEAFAVLGKETGSAWNQKELIKLTEHFDGAVGDIVRALIEKGYSRSQEEEADRYAVQFAAAIGYEPEGLVRFLEKMEKSTKDSGKPGMLKTHPSAKDRRKSVAAAVKDRTSQGTDPAPRVARFKKHMTAS